MQRAQRAERRTAPHSIIINSPSRRRPAATKRRHATGSVTPRSYSYASWLRVAHSVPTLRSRSLWRATQACRRGVCVGVRTLAHSSKKAARLSVLQGGRGYIPPRLRLRLVCLRRADALCLSLPDASWRPASNSCASADLPHLSPRLACVVLRLQIHIVIPTPPSLFIDPRRHHFTVARRSISKRTSAHSIGPETGIRQAKVILW